MRKSVVVCLLAINAILAFSTVYAVPVHQWSTCFGGPGNNTAYDVAVDGSGNIVIVGTFVGAMTIGGQVLASAGASDIFLAKFDANGVHQWSQRFGGTGNDVGKSVTVDGAGNIVMTGHFRGPVSVGGDPLPGRALQDIVVAKYDGAGLHQWSQWYGSAGGDEGQDVVADASGNLIVTGLYGGVIQFGGGADTPAFGGADMFVLKLDAAGGHQWSKGMGSASTDAGYGIAVDASNRVSITGVFTNTVDFGGGSLTSAGSTDAFVVTYAENGDHLWSARLGDAATDVGQGIAADAMGGIVVTGTNNGAFLLKYDPNGALEWSQSFRSTVLVQGQDVALGPGGTIVLTGNLRGTTSFGGASLTSAGDDDAFLAFFEGNGTHRWSQRFGNTGDDWGHGCYFDPSGGLTVTGVFSSSVDFGGGPLVSAGLNDVYVLKFAEEADTSPPVITCPADAAVEQTTPEGTPATHAVIAAFLTGASASDGVDPAPVVTHDAPDTFPVGTTSVTFRATDAAGNFAECTATVEVVDTTPPQITLVLDKELLWPPNNQYETVCAKVTVSDNGTGEPTFWLVSITSDEPVERGPRQRAQDISGAEFGTPDLCFELRAKRAGNGDGRVYTITYATIDGSGNTVHATAFVRVPHDMSATLTSVHPNPFNPQTTLEYTLSVGDRVQIAIYDVRGSLVRRLVNQVMPAGEHRVTWNGLDQAGRPAGSGIYFVKLSAGSDVDTRKIVLLK
ncbi:MAG TPA: HYR domain-containing protein [Candidatus Krumholzibacteria bacterium]|nr:HYR domain-containing protein [Candidatus Krumholzibacteria bacterium]